MLKKLKLDALKVQTFKTSTENLSGGREGTHYESICLDLCKDDTLIADVRRKN